MLNPNGKSRCMKIRGKFLKKNYLFGTGGTEMEQRVLAGIREDFQVGSEDWNDVLFTGHGLRWTQKSKSPKGALQSTHESDEPRWRDGKGSWPHGQETPEPGVGQRRTSINCSVRTTIHRQVDVEDKKGKTAVYKRSRRPVKTRRHKTISTWRDDQDPATRVRGEDGGHGGHGV